MKHKRFIKKWKQIKSKGFKQYLLSRALMWTLIMFPILRAINWYFKEIDPVTYTKLWWELPMFFMSGICFALIIWIVNNYLYAKYTGEFTPENHHHDYD